MNLYSQEKYFSYFERHDTEPKQKVVQQFRWTTFYMLSWIVAEK